MFDFEKLEVYGKAKNFNKSINEYIKTQKLISFQSDQLKRAALSIVLNIAEVKPTHVIAAVCTCCGL